ncbi:MAG TPA: hypothetical protein VMU01_10355 [Rhizomicrobium sp.]|nr:hypothetical protein [Rhizomicrobium sp.]
MKQSGSALVEALVAAAIVMMSLTTLYQAVADGTKRVRMGEQRSMALLVAQSALASVGGVIPASPGRSSGTEGPFVWTVEVKPFEPGGGSQRLLSVSVDVKAGDGPVPLVTLQTLRQSDAP